jgi:malate dehydrogenase (oxaloacetate-decarboxylating)(NADP+)
MFYAAAQTLADQLSDDSLGAGCLLPDLKLIREISAQVAVAVCEQAYTDGLAELPRPDDLEMHVRRQMYYPRYRPYQPA